MLTCATCQVIKSGIETYEMLSDWDGYVEKETEAFEAATTLLGGGPEAWKEAIVDPYVYNWENNPGNAAGGAAVDIASIAIPGGIVLKGLKVERALAGAANGARFSVASSGETTLSLRAGSGAWIEVDEHAALRMTQRNISIDAAEAAMANQPFSYFHTGVWKTGYYDPSSRVFVGSYNGLVTTVIDNVKVKYVNNLKAATP